MSLDSILVAPIEFAKKRGNNTNPNHHLWNNNGTWWVHFTYYPTPLTKERVRMSLKTRSVDEARQLRDRLLFGKEVAS